MISLRVSCYHSPRLKTGTFLTIPMNDKIIDSLFGSKTKARLLKLFLHNPELSFGLDEISAKTKLPRNIVKKELAGLLNLKIIRTIHRHDRKKKKIKK